MTHNNEKTSAFLTHIASFGGFFFPLGSILTPLILWQTFKNRSPFLDKQGKEAVNFNISYGLYMILASLMTTLFFMVKFLNPFKNMELFLFDFNGDLALKGLLNLIGISFLVGVIGLIKIVLIISAAIKANKGEEYTYPFTIRFIK